VTTGILPSFADRLLRQPRPKRGALSGQAIAFKGGPTPYIAVDADGHLHLLLAPAAIDLARLQRFRRPAFDLDNRPWSVSGTPIENYLDLTLVAPPVSPLRRPFLSFCEDILADLENGLSPEAAVYRTCSRWERFWEESIQLSSVTWILGLLGELVMLELLVTNGGPTSILSWTGPDSADHDFQAGTTAALEVKTSVQMPPVIECGLAQLDTSGAGDLFLAVLHATSREGALTLPVIVGRVEERLSGDEDALDLFLAKLARTGYRRHLAIEYSAHAFDIAPPIYYFVDDAFPRITHASFRYPLDARVRGVRYSVELTGIAPLSPDDARLRLAFRALSRA
jgi:hypothetical protein